MCDSEVSEHYSREGKAFFKFKYYVDLFLLNCETWQLRPVLKTKTSGSWFSVLIFDSIQSEHIWNSRLSKYNVIWPLSRETIMWQSQNSQLWLCHWYSTNPVTYHMIPIIGLLILHIVLHAPMRDIDVNCIFKSQISLDIYNGYLWITTLMHHLCFKLNRHFLQLLPIRFLDTSW